MAPSGTSPVSSSRVNRATLNSLMSSVLYARARRSAPSYSAALALLVPLVDADVHFHYFVV